MVYVHVCTGVRVCVQVDSRAYRNMPFTTTVQIVARVHAKTSPRHQQPGQALGAGVWEGPLCLGFLLT